MLRFNTDDSILMRRHRNATLEPIRASFLDPSMKRTEEAPVSPLQNLVLTVVGLLFAGFLVLVPLLTHH